MSIRAAAFVLVSFCVLFVAAEPAWAQQGPGAFPMNPGGSFVGGVPGDAGNLSLVINQTQETHEQIEGMLEQLRRLQGFSTVIEMPFNTVNDDFYERIGVDFDFSLPGSNNLVGLDPLGNPTPDGRLNFTQGSFNSTLPPFGGHDPATDARFGFLNSRNGANFDFNFAAGQGNNRTFTTQSPVLHLMDGQTGSVIDASVTPFVTSVIPVVGGGGYPIVRGRYNIPTLPPALAEPSPSPLQQAIQQYYREKKKGKPATATNEKQQTATRLLANPNLSREDKVALKLAASRGSSAGHGDLSVAEIRRRKAVVDAAEKQIKDQEILVLVEKARGAEEAGKVGVAKIYLRQALNRASGELKQQLVEKLRELGN